MTAGTNTSWPCIPDMCFTGRMQPLYSALCSVMLSQLLGYEILH